jgi:hypothetical protein
MPGLNEIARSVYGAWRLAHFDQSGMYSFNLSIEGFWRSFFAMVLSFGFLIVRDLLSAPPEPVPEGEPLIELSLAAGTFAFVLDWVLYPVVMAVVTRLMGIDANYVPFIIAHNWSKFFGQTVLAFAAMIATFLLGMGAPFLVLLLVGVYFVYMWFVTKTALLIPGSTAAALVILGFLLTVVTYVGVYVLDHAA